MISIGNKFDSVSEAKMRFPREIGHMNEVMLYDFSDFKSQIKRRISEFSLRQGSRHAHHSYLLVTAFANEAKRLYDLGHTRLEVDHHPWGVSDCYLHEDDYCFHRFVLHTVEKPRMMTPEGGLMDDLSNLRLLSYYAHMLKTIRKLDSKINEVKNLITDNPLISDECLAEETGVSLHRLSGFAKAQVDYAGRRAITILYEMADANPAGAGELFSKYPLQSNGSLADRGQWDDLYLEARRFDERMIALNEEVVL